MFEQVVRELAPAQFALIDEGGLPAVGMGGRRFLHGLPNLPNADLPEMQMGRQPGCAFPVRPIRGLRRSRPSHAEGIGVEP